MLAQQEIEIIIKAFEPYSPNKIALFGSTARNQEGDKSDIDILYALKRPISLFTLAGIQIFLEEKLGRKVDLVSEEALHPKLKDGIMGDLKVLYAAA